jgi:Rrf2 family transcriptional regulator, iron-sulfur cluster assembly transcription factor
MRLTTKGRYAVTAMLDLAIHANSAPVTLADISLRQGISLSYLEQLFARLRRSGLVLSVRGPGGGYRLGDTTAAISIAGIIAAVDESVDATRCEGKGNCHDGEICLTHHLWDDLTQRIRQYLAGISLADLAEKYQVQRAGDDHDGRRTNQPVESLITATFLQ